MMYINKTNKGRTRRMSCVSAKKAKKIRDSKSNRGSVQVRWMTITMMMLMMRTERG